MSKYDFTTIEKKWQQFWADHKTFRAADPGEPGAEKPKFYVLDMFPYPSGDGLHVGHPEGYTATDIVCRYKRMKGFNVLHPMGWDAFGLPAERYAVKTGQHPRTTTLANIETFRRQIKSLGFSYDWDREIDTTDPGYYKWTQWIFLQMYNKGLAYLHEAPVNWCEQCGTVLANEEVDAEGKCDQGHDVVRRPMKQWMLRITAYAERLLADLDLVDWPESIKKLQRDWIGKSVGAEVDFRLAPESAACAGQDQTIRVFTTRPDTLFGATYMVLAPEHPLVGKITTDAQRDAVNQYIDQAAKKSDLARTDLAREKTGVATGAFAVNPVNNSPIPIWVADYVLISYGTGAIMAVPGHDQRDWEFARTFDLPIVEVISGGDVTQAAHEGDGTLVNSACDELGVNINGLPVESARDKITDWLVEKQLGEKSVNYRLRDWLFSRQRYWGEPFPILHLEDGALVPMDEADLPLTLPELDDYKPHVSGQSPLANLSDWIHTEHHGRPVRRESNTMPQWAGSCWYYLRYLDPKNDACFCDPEKERFWMGDKGVDLYIGGAEHAVLHLLYSRFWHKVLYDLGFVSTPEPFHKLFNQGMILGEDGVKMSKSRGNVINPDAVIAENGADTMRLYEMYMGPLEAAKPWNTRDIAGVGRFLQRVWRNVIDPETGELLITETSPEDKDLLRRLHKTIKKVAQDVENLRFNTAIAAMIELNNALVPLKTIPRSVAEPLILILSPFAPHIAEELWRRLGHSESLAREPWPDYDEALTRDETLVLPIQVKGKVKARLTVSADTPEADLKARALTEPAVQKALAGKTPRKVIVVPGRMISIVV